MLSAQERSTGPQPPPPLAGDVANRRSALNAVLEQANNVAQPIAPDVVLTNYTVHTVDGAALHARWYRLPSSDSRAAVLYLHGGGMILGSVPIFDGTVSRYVANTGVPMLSLNYRLGARAPTPHSRRGRLRRAAVAR